MNHTILVIEDDRQIRTVVEGYLHQAGYRVLSATDGVTGLALAQQEKPTLLILDLMLPEWMDWRSHAACARAMIPYLPTCISSC